LVDEDANIIWGSAFNPDLQGKIRVSVVATGIDGTGEVNQAAPRNYALSGSRAPKRPVLELPAEDEFELPAEAEMEDEPQGAGGFGSAPQGDALELGSGGGGFAEDEAEEEYDDDVDGIVDPLAGLRNDDADSDPTEPQGYGADEDDAANDAELWSSTPPSSDEPLELESPASGSQDELLLDADRLAAQDEPVKPMLGGRRRGLVTGSESGGAGSGGGGGGGGGSSSAGSTLFERMANLSRGGTRPAEEEEETEEDDSGSASLSIPRFLGRQNNQ
jgi:cell division protein FtsZ